MEDSYSARRGAGRGCGGGRRDGFALSGGGDSGSDEISERLASVERSIKGVDASVLRLMRNSRVALGALRRESAQECEESPRDRRGPRPAEGCAAGAVEAFLSTRRGEAAGPAGGGGGTPGARGRSQAARFAPSAAPLSPTQVPPFLAAMHGDRPPVESFAPAWANPPLIPAPPDDGGATTPGRGKSPFSARAGPAPFAGGRQKDTWAQLPVKPPALRFTEDAERDFPENSSAPVAAGGTGAVRNPADAPQSQRSLGRRRRLRQPGEDAEDAAGAGAFAAEAGPGAGASARGRFVNRAASGPGTERAPLSLDRDSAAKVDLLRRELLQERELRSLDKTAEADSKCQLTHRVHFLTNSVTRLEHELNAAVSELHEVRARLDTAQRQLRQRDEELVAAHQEIAAAKEERSAVENDLYLAGVDRKSLQERMQEHEDRALELASAKRVLEARVAALTGQKTAAESRATDADLLARNLQSKLADQVQGKNALQHRFDELEAEHSKLKLTVAEVRAALHAKGEADRARCEQLSAAQARVGALEAELGAAQRGLRSTNELQTELFSRSKELQAVQARCASLEADQARYQRELRAAEGARAAAEGRARELANELFGARQEAAAAVRQKPGASSLGPGGVGVVAPAPTSRSRRCRKNANDSSALTEALFGRRETGDASQATTAHEAEEAVDAGVLEKQLTALQLERGEIESVLSKLNDGLRPGAHTLHGRSVEADCEAKLRELTTLINSVKSVLRKSRA